MGGVGCTGCGAELRDGARFCAGCGGAISFAELPLLDPLAAVVDPTVFCELDWLRYLGIHLELPNPPIERVRLVIGWDGIAVIYRWYRRPLFAFPEEIIAITEINGDELQGRWSKQDAQYPTITTLNPRARVLLVETLEGDMAFEDRYGVEGELRDAAAPFLAMPQATPVAPALPAPQVMQPSAPEFPVAPIVPVVQLPAPVASSPSPVGVSVDRRDRLLELRSLHDEELITDAEFEKRRAEIIGEI